MAERALADGPSRDIFAVLPDAGWAVETDVWLARLGIESMIGEVDPWSLLSAATTLYAHCDDELALLAIVAGSRVLPFGPDVAGGSPSSLRRELKRALLDDVRYRDPFTGAVATPEKIVALLQEWRRVGDANRDITVAVGMAWWKRKSIERLLWSARSRPLRSSRNASEAVRQARAAGGAIAAWPSRMPADLRARATAAGVGIRQVEDGFVRSIGLGSDLHPPCSIVVDGDGMYYDPGRSSALERILEAAPFDDALLARATAIIAMMTSAGIGKYGSGRGPPVADRPRARRRILVAGQVEDDRSVALGGAGVRGNLDLLQRARRAEPDAELWFRPHPDVDAGHRRGAIADHDARGYADRIVRGGAMASLLDQVDGVHVLTSQTGFEALLRRRLDVVTHGQPFYAGWGLTHDLAPAIARRTRRLTLEQLVAATLILYPRYVDPVTGLPCPIEVLLDRFARPIRARPSWLIRARQWQGRLRRFLAQAAA